MLKMLNGSLILSLNLIVMGNLLSESIVGNNIGIEKNRDLALFSKVSVEGGIIGRILYEDQSRVKIKGEANLVDSVETEVKGDELLVRFRHGNGYKMHQPVEVTIYAKNITRISVSSGSLIEATTLSTGQLDVFASSGGTIELKNIDIDTLNLRASSGSHVAISGRSKVIDISSSGGAQIEAMNLLVDKCEVTASGASILQLNSALTVHGNISGSSQVIVSEKAGVRVGVTGNSKILSK